MLNHETQYLKKNPTVIHQFISKLYEKTIVRRS